MQKRIVALLGALALTTLAAPGAARAQRLLDWPIRVTAGAEALGRGAAAAFWNPAAASLPGSRAQAFVMDMQGFRDSGLSGVAVAGAIDLNGDLALAAGYAHLGLGPIPLTSTSPADDLGEADVAEDLFAIAAARDLGSGLRVGVAAQYSRGNGTLEHRSDEALGAGLHFAPAMRLEPVIGASILSRGGASEWLLGAGLDRLAEPVDGLKIGASWGGSGGHGRSGFAQRAAVTARWRDVLGGAIGAAAEPGSDGTRVEPILGADLQLGRYRLAVLRESIVNGFGAAYYYQLHVLF